METRGKMKKLSLIKLTQFFHKMKAFIVDFNRNSIRTASFFIKSFAKLNHNFCMFFFYNQKRKNHFTHRLNFCFINNPFKLFFPMWIFLASATVYKPIEVGFKPFNKHIVSINYKNPAVEGFRIFGIVPNVKSSFSVHDSSKISNFGYINHKNSNLLVSLRLTYKLDNFKSPAETKPRGTRKSEVIVRTLWKHSEGGITRLPASCKEVINLNKVSNSNSTLINQDPVLNEAASRLGQSMRETEDQLIRDMLAGTASLVNSVNGVNGDNPTELTRADIDGVVATLQGNDGEFISTVIEGQDKFGTGPVRDSYFGMCDTRMIGQLENANGFINTAQYPNQKNISPAEWGSIGNVRFFLSSRGSVTTGASLLAADVYNIFITAQDAYAKIEQNGVSAKFIYHAPGHGDDPAELRQTCAWRMAQVPRITNDAWIINLRATIA